jgi:hypothetical protein
MITVKKTNRDDTLEIHMTAPVTESDYENVMVPAIDDAIAASDHVRLLVTTDVGPADFTLGAMWDDAKLGLRSWRGFERIAYVTANTGMARVVRAVSALIPCPVMVFAPEDIDAARRWLTESLGAVHQTDLGDGVLHLQLLGKLDRSLFAEEARDLDAFIRRNDRFRLLLDIREFDGWQGLGALADHFRLVRDHHDLLDRAAIVGAEGWQKTASSVGARLIGREPRYFEAAQIEAAEKWLKEG